MSSTPATSAPMDSERRTALITTGVLGCAGAAAVAAPFLASLTPSERARAAGAPVEFDLAQVPPGEMRTVEWRGKPVWILHRTPEMIAAVKKTGDRVADPKSARTNYPTPDYAKNELRSVKPEYLIAVGICSHLGCNPIGPVAANGNPQLGEDAGFVCPCHGSTFDLAGRVFKNKPAPDNLEVPPHRFLSDTLVLIGEDAKA